MEKLAAYSDEKNAGPSPLSVLVKKLQESLSRIESFEVTTVAAGMEGEFFVFPYVIIGDLTMRQIPSAALPLFLLVKSSCG